MLAHFFPFSFFKLLENAWYQQKAGILDQAQWVGWRRCCASIIMPRECSGRGGRRAKTVIRRNFRSSFPKQSRLKSSAHSLNCSTDPPSEKVRRKKAEGRS